MKKYFCLLKLQIKNAFLTLPKIFAGTLIFSVVLCAVALGAQAADKSSDAPKMQVAVVLPDDKYQNMRDEDKYVRNAFEYLGQIDSVKNVCEFVFEADEVKALEDLKNEIYTAVVVIPERFISSIMNGENIPARVIFKESGVNVTSSVFQEMLRAGASDLSTAQAGIYAVDDVVRALINQNGALEKSNAHMNSMYMSFCLDRNIYFENISAQDRGQPTALQFYTAAGFVAVMLLTTLVCASLLAPDEQALADAFWRRGISGGVSQCMKILGVTIVFYSVYAVMFVLASLSVMRFPEAADIVSAADGFRTTDLSKAAASFKNIGIGLAALFVLLLAVISMAGMVYRLLGGFSMVSGVLFLFFISVVMMFASGLFIPSEMLPPAVVEIAEFLPTTWFFRLCAQILTGTVQAACVLANAAYAVFFIAVSSVVSRALHYRYGGGHSTYAKEDLQ